MSNENEDDMSKVMGFSHFGGPKKAKQFDFMKMFEEARNTAIERSTPNLGDITSDPTEQPPSNPVVKGPSSSKFKGPANKPADSDDDDDNDDDDEEVGPPLPPSLAKATNSGEDEDEEDIGPPLPAHMKTASSLKEGKHDSDSESDDDEDDGNPVKKIPSSHEVDLKHGHKTISALALDPSGARLCTGSADYDVKFWDFAGMDVGMRSFRSIRPCESHAIRHLEYSPSGDVILIVSGNSQAKVVDRDGFEKFECIKGDQYLTDMASTKGHAAMLNSGCWHPRQKGEFMTCSQDGTVRVWDVNQEGKKHAQIIKCKSTIGRKIIPTACSYSPDGKWIAVASDDGSIQFWDRRKKFYWVNVAMSNRSAHQKGTDTSSIAFSYDGNSLATRGGDDTVKLWDLRQIKKPLCEAGGMESVHTMTDCCFSPDDKMVVTGTSVRPGHGTGKLLFLDRQTLQRVSELDVLEGESVVRCLWHPRLNQIVVGCGDGTAKIYYDPDKSHRGAKLSVVKTKRKSKQVQMMVANNIVTPHALPMFRKDKPTSTRKQEVKDRKDPLKSHKPDMPMAGPGTGGRVAVQGATLSQYVSQLLVKRKPDDRDRDPRAAILRHAEEAVKNPFYVAPAYEKNQPETVFQEVESDEEEDDTDQPQWKKHKV